MRRIALAVALVLAVTAIGTHVRSGWFPGCVLIERYSLEWYLLGCFYGEPDPPGAEG